VVLFFLFFQFYFFIIKKLSIRRIISASLEDLKTLYTISFLRTGDQDDWDEWLEELTDKESSIQELRNSLIGDHFPILRGL